MVASHAESKSITTRYFLFLPKVFFMKLFISGFLFCCCFAACKGQSEHSFKIQKDDNTLLWRVSGNGLAQPSFLFGTFHLLCKDDIHFSDQLLQAVKASKEMYMELDMDDPSTLLSGMLVMNMKNGKKLEDLYSPEEYQRVKNYFNDTLHAPIMMFQKAKPYFLVALLYPRMMNCTTPAGVEEELLKVAKENKKEIQGLETMQFQASVFDSIPYDWQAKELLKNIDSFPVYKKEFDDMVTLYKQQNLDSMQSMLVKSEFGSDKYEDLLLNNRNRNWVTQLKKIMDEESVFVAVGAGHLTGDNGLINLLRKAGYKVEPLLNK